MGGMRLITAGKALWDGDLGAQQCAHVAVAAAALAGTFFGHPLGMLITSMHDLVIGLGRLTESLQEGDYKRAMLELLHAINETLYVSLFLGAGVEIVVASLCAQFLIGIQHSWAHLQKGEQLEGVSHLLMSLIRGHQAIRQFQAICIQKEIQKTQEEGKPYLPLANRIQIFFTNAGYRINGLARWTIRQISLGLSPAQSTFSQFQTAAKVMLISPIVLASFLISTPCYLAASYTGIGRFERIDAQNPSSFAPTDQIHVMFQNICGQNPWSVFTSGHPPPLEEGPDGKRRIDAILETILKENPDIYCGQEYDDLDTSRILGEQLAREGYTCVRDVGCNDPFFNHSGMFMASRSGDVANSIAFTPIAPEHTSGITYWCNRGLLSADIPMQDGAPLKVVNIHLNAGESPENQVSRLQQFQHYVSPLVQGLRALIVGDSNLDTAALSEKQKETAGLSNLVNALEGQVTCTDEAKHSSNGKPREGCNECEERIDVALFDPNKIVLSDLKIQPGNSDHHAISLTIG
jgi:endonuclease/exonuclease/phosphatase family metal-dependent hydrolase